MNIEAHIRHGIHRGRVKLLPPRIPAIRAIAIAHRGYCRSRERIVSDQLFFKRYGFWSRLIASMGSCALNTLLPATNTSAPWAYSLGALSRLTPPSISIRVWSP